MIFEIHDLNIEAGNDVAFCHHFTGAAEQKQTAKRRLRGCGGHHQRSANMLASPGVPCLLKKTCVCVIPAALLFAGRP